MDRETTPKPEAPWDEWDDYAACYVCRGCGAAEGYRVHGPTCRENRATGAVTPMAVGPFTVIDVRAAQPTENEKRLTLMRSLDYDPTSDHGVLLAALAESERARKEAEERLAVHREYAPAQSELAGELRARAIAAESAHAEMVEQYRKACAEAAVSGRALAEERAKREAAEQGTFINWESVREGRAAIKRAEAAEARASMAERDLADWRSIPGAQAIEARVTDLASQVAVERSATQAAFAQLEQATALLPALTEALEAMKALPRCHPDCAMCEMAREECAASARFDAERKVGG